MVKCGKFFSLALDKDVLEMLDKEKAKGKFLSELLTKYYRGELVEINVPPNVKKAYDDDFFKSFRTSLLLTEYYQNGSISSNSMSYNHVVSNEKAINENAVTRDSADEVISENGNIETSSSSDKNKNETTEKKEESIIEKEDIQLVIGDDIIVQSLNKEETTLVINDTEALVEDNENEDSSDSVEEINDSQKEGKDSVIHKETNTQEVGISGNAFKVNLSNDIDLDGF